MEGGFGRGRGGIFFEIEFEFDDISGMGGEIVFLW